MILLSRNIFLALLASSCHCQYQMDNDVRADITFNADNDRYDVGNIMNEQKRVFNDMPSQMEENWRRSLPLLAEVLKQKRRRYQQARQNPTTDFAYHDLMLNEHNYMDGQYDKQLDRLKNKNQSQRRSDHLFFNHLINKPQKQKNQSIVEGLQDVVLDYLHGGKILKRGRRKSDGNPENEVLLHYAVPLRMKVTGFLEMPDPKLV